MDEFLNDLFPKLHNGNVRAKECIYKISDSRVWECCPKEDTPGTLAIFILKIFMEFLPESLPPPGRETLFLGSKKSCVDELDEILQDLDKVIWNILQELDNTDFMCVDQMDSRYILFCEDNPKFHMFARSPLFIKLFRNCFEVFCRIKKEEIKREVRGRLKRHEHLQDLTFFASCFKYLMGTLFMNPSKEIEKYTYVQIVIPDQQRFKFNIPKFIGKIEKLPNFALNLQEFIVKYAPCEPYEFIGKYKSRTHIIKNIVHLLFPRYVHLMWDVIEDKKVYKNEGKKIVDIHNLDFAKFFLTLGNNINLYFRGEDIELTIFETLYFDFLIKQYFEKVLQFELWDKFKAMDPSKEFIERTCNTNYPIVVRLFRTMYGVYFDGIIYFGNVFYAYWKYKHIVRTNFQNEIKIWNSNMEQSYDISDFFVFRKM